MASRLITSSNCAAGCAICRRDAPSAFSSAVTATRSTSPYSFATARRSGQKAWSQHRRVPEPTPPPQSGSSESFLAATFVPSRPVRGFLDTEPKGLYVGADVNPVRTQLADYFGVRSGTGLLVENVDSQSPAARAGLKAGDVVAKVESRR